MTKELSDEQAARLENFTKKMAIEAVSAFADVENRTAAVFMMAGGLLDAALMVANELDSEINVCTVIAQMMAATIDPVPDLSDKQRTPADEAARNVVITRFLNDVADCLGHSALVLLNEHDVPSCGIVRLATSVCIVAAIKLCLVNGLHLTDLREIIEKNLETLGPAPGERTH